MYDTELTEEQKSYAVDLAITLVIDELSKSLNGDTSTILTNFMSSNVGKLLYDESSKLWCEGPSYIANMYKEELARADQNPEMKIF
jgi:hypothetical protein